MEIVVVSDSHGRIEVLNEILKAHPNADAYIHCGDLELPDTYFPQFIRVKGNNDYYANVPHEIVTQVNDLKVLITHSHQYTYIQRKQQLAKKAEHLGCKLVCYGHTHVFHDEVIDGIQLVNPGSCWINRDRSDPSYAVVTVEAGKMTVKRINVKI
ncbi:MAG: metallophosphoesterase [Erysipelotrichaceae bacterium]|nr:metallophosphoesterase [Erysipelotrichaceae bacterium]